VIFSPRVRPSGKAMTNRVMFARVVSLFCKALSLFLSFFFTSFELEIVS